MTVGDLRYLLDAYEANQVILCRDEHGNPVNIAGPETLYVQKRRYGYVDVQRPERKPLGLIKAVLVRIRPRDPKS